MILQLGNRKFDHVFYDAEGDVLYLSTARPAPAKETLASPEGHAIRLNAEGDIIGITVVNAKRLAERDGRITVTVPATTSTPELLEAPADALRPALVT